MIRIIIAAILIITLLKTNILPKHAGFQVRNLLFHRSIFKGQNVSFMEGYHPHHSHRMPSHPWFFSAASAPQAMLRHSMVRLEMLGGMMLGRNGEFVVGSHQAWRPFTQIGGRMWGGQIIQRWTFWMKISTWFCCC